EAATHIRLHGGAARAIGSVELVQSAEVQQLPEVQQILRRRVEPVVLAAAAADVGVGSPEQAKSRRHVVRVVFDRALRQQGDLPANGQLAEVFGPEPRVGSLEYLPGGAAIDANALRREWLAVVHRQ